MNDSWEEIHHNTKYIKPHQIMQLQLANGIELDMEATAITVGKTKETSCTEQIRVAQYNWNKTVIGKDALADKIIITWISTTCLPALCKAGSYTWHNSDIAHYLNDDLFYQIPMNIRGLIKPINTVRYGYSASSNTKTFLSEKLGLINSLSCIWIPSRTDVYGASIIDPNINKTDFWIRTSDNKFGIMSYWNGEFHADYPGHVYERGFRNTHFEECQYGIAVCFCTSVK